MLSHAEPVCVRNTGGGLGLHLSGANEVLSLVPGGQAEADDVPLNVGDRIVGVNGQLLGGRSLSSVLPHGGNSFVLMVRRAQPGTTSDAQPHESVSGEKIVWAEWANSLRDRPKPGALSSAHKHLDDVMVDGAACEQDYGDPAAFLRTQARAPCIPSFEVPIQSESIWPIPRGNESIGIPTPGRKQFARVPPMPRNPNMWRPEVFMTQL